MNSVFAFKYEVNTENIMKKDKFPQLFFFFFLSNPWIQPEVQRSTTHGSHTVMKNTWSLLPEKMHINDLHIHVAPPPQFTGEPSLAAHLGTPE